MTVLLNDIRHQLLHSHNLSIEHLSEVHRDQKLIARIAAITQLDEKIIEDAFSPSFEYKEHVFVQRIKKLQQLRNQL